MRTIGLCLFSCGFALLIGGNRAAVGQAAATAPNATERAIAAVGKALVRIHVVDVRYQSGREVKSEATGSGVIWTKEGHVVTNHHVAGHAKQILCMLADKEEIDAELVGTDPLTDICVIKLLPRDRREFPVAKFGDSSRLKVGDRVLAMGSPRALSQSVTMGIVSNVELVMPGLFWPRRLELEGEDVGAMVRWIGHDAEISPGSSGGPLVNLEGEVVGINEMVFGLGAAIPGELALEVAEQLRSDGDVVRASLGLEVQPLLRSQRGATGVLVSGTISQSPAERAGFVSGDILVSLGGRAVSVRVAEELPAFNQLVAKLPLGEEIEAAVVRGGNTLRLRVSPEKREPRQPLEQEISKWGMTARNLSSLEAKEMRRESRDGVLVTSVRPGGPADAAKPRVVEGDVIVEASSTPIQRVVDLTQLTKTITEGQTGPVPVVVRFDRRGEHYLTVLRVDKQRLSEPGREARKAWLGAAIQVLTRDIAEELNLGDRTGVRVTQVFPDSPAEKAGLRVGDFIVGIDGMKVPASRPEHLDVFAAMVRQYRIGSEVELALIRGEEEVSIRATLQQSPTPPREMAKYRDDEFEFTVRDLAIQDRFRRRWKGPERGAVVDAVSEGGWAALGHLGVGDLILSVDGNRTVDVASLEERMRAVAAARPKAVLFQVRRGIHDLFIELRPKWSEEE
jgi:serine protease Do